MSVRKRTWKSPSGEPKEAWVVDYVDQHGDRHIKTFAKKRDADAHHAFVGVAVRAGTHTADSKSVTVAKAAELWLESCEAAGLERATMAAYRQHADLHITPILGALRLSQLTVPVVRGFEDRLRRDGRSPAMVRNARRALGGILADAQERGLVAQNVVYSLRKNRRRAARRWQRQAQDRRRHPGAGRDARHRRQARHSGRTLPAAVAYGDLHRAARLRAARAALARRRPEARRAACAPARRSLRQDRAAEVGGGRAHGAAAADGGRRAARAPPRLPEERAGHRVCQQPRRIEHRNTIVEHGFHPAQVAAGVVDGDGKAKYTGLHSLRHFYASWCINRRVDGGLELPLKVVQARLGHASIQMTADTYGHLFPRGDDGAELAAAEKAFLG